MNGTKFRMTVLGVMATLATATVAPAQARGPQGVPHGLLLPAGLCRVWYDGVPPGRQPAPTSCRDAERRVGRNARVIYGDARSDRRQQDRWDDHGNDQWGASGQFRGGVGDGRGEPGRGRVGGSGRSRIGNGGTTSCTYLDANGRCSSTVRRDMPMMSRTNTLDRNQRTEIERYWLGSGAMTARYIDRDRNGVPEEILWYDRRGALVQRWQDSDHDGRVDEIVIYNDGAARVIR